MKTYGTFELTVASPPQSIVEPIDTRQVRTWLGLNETDPDDDQDLLLEALISAARSVAEIHQHRELAVKQWDYRLDEFPTDEIELTNPLVSVDLVQYTASTGTTTAMVDGTDYALDSSRGFLTPIYGGSWPSATLGPSGSILIRFTSGYAPSNSFWTGEGSRIIQGMRLLISMWHENRIPVGEAPQSVIWLFNMNPRLNIQ